MKFALFFIAEYVNMISTSAIMATLFFGGWKGPFAEQYIWLGPIYLLIKVVILLFLFVWVRASIGRPRYDQLMKFCWQFMLPLSLAYVSVSAVLAVFLK